MKSAVLFALLSAAAVAQAADVGQHPAVFSPRSLPGIDASTFIVGHPARGAAGRAETVVAQPKTSTEQKAAIRAADQAPAQTVAQRATATSAAQ